MNINLLHFDDALLGQPQFMEKCARLGALDVDMRDLGPGVRLWGDNKKLDEIRDRLQSALSQQKKSGPIVSWLGSGDFHHVSAILIPLIMSSRPANSTVLHFDNHPDWVRHKNGIHCGSWVNYLLENQQVNKVISLGVSSNDLAWPEFKGASLNYLKQGKIIIFPLHPPRTFVLGQYGKGAAHKTNSHTIEWTSLDNKAAPEGLNEILKLVDTSPLYITIDKDVLAPMYASTNWDQGKLTLKELLNWLRALCRHCNIAGVDIVGDYSQTNFKGSLFSKLAKWGEVIMDQPRRTMSQEKANSINQTSNLALMSVLETCL